VPTTIPSQRMRAHSGRDPALRKNILKNIKSRILKCFPAFIKFVLVFYFCKNFSAIITENVYIKDRKYLIIQIEPGLRTYIPLKEYKQ